MAQYSLAVAACRQGGGSATADGLFLVLVWSAVICILILVISTELLVGPIGCVICHHHPSTPPLSWANRLCTFYVNLQA